jgi:hypothetical protein
MLKWRVLFLKAVRGIMITSLQKAHLREHNDQSKKEDEACSIVPHCGFRALVFTRGALLRAPGRSIQQAACNLPATCQLQAAATGKLQASKLRSSCNWQLSG